MCSDATALLRILFDWHMIQLLWKSHWSGPWLAHMSHLKSHWSITTHVDLEWPRMSPNISHRSHVKYDWLISHLNSHFDLDWLRLRAHIIHWSISPALWYYYNYVMVLKVYVLYAYLHVCFVHIDILLHVCVLYV